jgi:hypothetical protein
MKIFLKKVAIFLSIPLLLYIITSIFLLPSLISKVEGPSTEQQILMSFENAKKGNYDLMALGNSRMYRGIDPSVFDCSSYNFSHDNDTYNQMYYKLKWLE